MKWLASVWSALTRRGEHPVSREIARYEVRTELQSSQTVSYFVDNGVRVTVVGYDDRATEGVHVSVPVRAKVVTVTWAALPEYDTDHLHDWDRHQNGQHEIFESKQIECNGKIQSDGMIHGKATLTYRLTRPINETDSPIVRR